MKKDEKRTFNKNFFDALANAFNGIRHGIKTQINLKVQIVITILVIIAGFYFKFNCIEFAFLVFSCGLVLVTEMLNTAIETSVNLTTTEYNPIAKIAKDVGAGSVLIASLNALVIGCILFLGKII